MTPDCAVDNSFVKNGDYTDIAWLQEQLHELAIVLDAVVFLIDILEEQADLSDDILRDRVRPSGYDGLDGCWDVHERIEQAQAVYIQAISDVLSAVDHA